MDRLDVFKAKLTEVSERLQFLEQQYHYEISRARALETLLLDAGQINRDDLTRRAAELHQDRMESIAQSLSKQHAANVDIRNHFSDEELMAWFD